VILRDLHRFYRQDAPVIKTELIRAQGRNLSGLEVQGIQDLINEHPSWSRHRLAKELCGRWQWVTPLGQLKTFAARSFLMTLAQRGLLRLPAVREQYRVRPWGLGVAEPAAGPVPQPLTEITGALSDLRPLRWILAPHGSSERHVALSYLRKHHYLGCNRPVGVHLLYLVQDFRGQDLAVHLVGAAAWHCAPRDQFIGWNDAQRRAGLHRLANHSRFLILPWVRVPHLASHLLSALTRRVAQDWRRHHGWELELLESFVEKERFRGTAYRAANWQEVGETTGRTRQLKTHSARSPRKRVWVYGLNARFRQRLSLAHNQRPSA